MRQKKERATSQVLYSRGSDAVKLRYYPILCTCKEERYLVACNLRFSGKGIINYLDDNGDVLFTLSVHFSPDSNSYSGLLYDRTSNWFVCEMVFVKDTIISEKPIVFSEISDFIVDYDDGSRWESEGDLSNGQAQGEFYDSENRLVYIGTSRNGRRCGFGETFYSDFNIPTIESRGFWVDGKQYGPFEIFDRQGHFIRTVVYFDGKRVNPDQIPADQLTFYSFSHNLLLPPHTSVPGSKIHFFNLDQLEQLSIGYQSFPHIESFRVSQLSSLKQLVIEQDCFLGLESFSEEQLKRVNSAATRGHHRQFAVTDCPNLESIEIGSHSFLLFQEVVIESTAKASESPTELPRLVLLEFGATGGEGSFSFSLTSQLELAGKSAAGR